jgi:peptide/nickel transport system substrate-binding protein
VDRRSLIIGGGLAAGALATGAFLSHGAKPGNGRFTVVVNQTPPLLDLALAANSANLLRPTIDNIVETMIQKLPSGAIGAGLCSWTISADSRTIDYRLRPGVRFHNGDLLTPDDVLFSHERMLRLSPTYRSRARDVTSVTVREDGTIRFVFRTSGQTYLRMRGAYVFSRAYFDQVGEAGFAAMPIGTGPYRLVDYADSQYADLDAFPEYWGPQPQVKRARILYVSEDMTRVAMLRSGEADMIMAVPFPMVPVLSRLGFGRVQADMHPTISLRFQLANPRTPWADLRVRRALAHAVDCDAMIQGLFGGVPNHYPGFAPSEEGFDPAMRPYRYDPDEARRLLAEAGYPNGFEIPLTYFSGAYYGLRDTTEVVTLYLRKIGIPTVISNIDAAKTVDFVRRTARDPTARVVTVSASLFASSGDPVDAMRFGYDSKTPQSWYHNAELDSYIAEASVASTAAARQAALLRCSHLIHRELPIVPLWNYVVVYMMRPGVSFTPTQRDVPLMMLKDVRLA